MPRFLAQITLTYKDGILDPQGVAVQKAAQALGFEGVKSARVGKYITLEIEASNEQEAEAEAKSMIEKFLANPVIENAKLSVKRLG